MTSNRWSSGLIWSNGLGFFLLHVNIHKNIQKLLRKAEHFDYNNIKIRQIAREKSFSRKKPIE